jgi:hypothetical protein
VADLAPGHQPLQISESEQMCGVKTKDSDPASSGRAHRQEFSPPPADGVTHHHVHTNAAGSSVTLIAQ